MLFSCTSMGTTPTVEWFFNGQPAVGTLGVTINGDTLNIADSSSQPLRDVSVLCQQFSSKELRG